MNQLHTEDEQVHSFDEVERVIADDLRFKRKLAIGADAYTSIRVAKSLQQVWDVGGVAATGGGLAASSTVAGTFFSTGGFMSAIGLGAAAVTPIGWVIGAAVASGGAYYGVTRLFQGYGDARVETIPKFINTHIDLLGAALLDLLGAFALKVSSIDGDVHEKELSLIKTYFVSEWGFDPLYTDKAVLLLEENADKTNIQDMSKALAAFAHSNPDCNFPAIRAELLTLLQDIANADGELREQEVLAIDKITQVLEQEAASLTAVGQVTGAPSKAWNWVSKSIWGSKA